MTFELKLFDEYAKDAGVTVTDDLQEKQVKPELLSMLKKQFLKFYEQCGLLENAATCVGLNTATILTWRSEDPEFKEKYDNTKDAFVTLLEDAAMKRALSGKDSLMLMFMLKANNPEKYDDKARTPSTSPSINIQITDVGGNKLADSGRPLALPTVIDGEIVKA